MSKENDQFCACLWVCAQQTCKNVCQARKFNRLRGGGIVMKIFFFLLIRYIN